MELPTYSDLALLILRVSLFSVFVYEGWTKLTNLKEHGKSMPGGVPLTLAVGAGQFFGSLGLLAGVLAQWAAWGLVLIMLGSILFNLKWRIQFHTTKQAGWDFNLLLLSISLTVALIGPGNWSLLS